MTYIIGAFINIDSFSLLIVVMFFSSIGFFVSRSILSKRLQKSSRPTINIYSAIIGVLFSILITTGLLFLLSI